MAYLAMMVGKLSASLPTASEGWGKVMFSVCSHRGGGGGVPQQGQDRGGYPKVSNPPWPRCKAKYPSPLAISAWGRGTPRYLPHQSRYPSSRPGQDGGRGYSKVPTPPPAKVPTLPSPPLGQHMEYLIRCGRYASCVHAGGFSSCQCIYRVLFCVLEIYLLAYLRHTC